MSSAVEHPTHYNSNSSGVECLDVARWMSFDLGSATKYLWRAGLKGDAIEDLCKAVFYIQDEQRRFAACEESWHLADAPLLDANAIAAGMTYHRGEAFKAIWGVAFQQLGPEWLAYAITQINFEIERLQAEEREEKMNSDDDLLREAFADYAHSAWSGWMTYMWSRCPSNPDGTLTIPADLVTRWQRQMSTAYKDLPESEKKSDRKEADEILAIVKGAVL